MDFLIVKERVLHNPENRKDGTTVEQLLHPDFKEVGASGTSYNLQSIIDLMETEDASHWHVHSQDFECMKVSENAFLLLYKSCMVQQGYPAQSFAKRSSIWVKQGDKWQIQYHQGTPCDAFELDSSR